MCLSQRVLNSNTIAYVSAAADLNTQRLHIYYILNLFKYKTHLISQVGFAMQLFQ